MKSSTRRIATDAMLAAMYVCLSYVSLSIGNSMKITLDSLPILVAALLLGPLDGLAVGLTGSFLSQLLTYGLSATTILRAVTVEEGAVPSRVSTWSYFVNENHTFPIVSLVADSFSEFYGFDNSGNKFIECPATVSLINRLYRPVESLLNIHVDFTRSLALFTRIFDYFDLENPITSPKNGRRPDVTDADIRYEHVSFSYDPEKPLLSDIDFTVPGGKMYAIVGPSGSGKSTVVNFIPRLYDVLGGRVTIAGVDVRDFDLSYLREQIGVVTQDSYLFNGTIRENLLYAKEDATEEEIEAACYIANLSEFLASQPEGLDTMVGNRGLKLSGGEKQRLSIARVILKDPKILILDEATSALDSITENAIQDALEALMEGRTSIVIAHRLSTILKADRILVVKDGVIAEQGSHEELLARNGTYRELYETQFRQILDYEDEKHKT